MGADLRGSWCGEKQEAESPGILRFLEGLWRCLLFIYNFADCIRSWR